MNLGTSLSKSFLLIRKSQLWDSTHQQYATGAPLFDERARKTGNGISSSTLPNMDIRAITHQPLYSLKYFKKSYLLLSTSTHHLPLVNPLQEFFFIIIKQQLSFRKNKRIEGNIKKQAHQNTPPRVLLIQPQMGTTTFLLHGLFPSCVNLQKR